MRWSAERSVLPLLPRLTVLSPRIAPAHPRCSLRSLPTCCPPHPHPHFPPIQVELKYRLERTPKLVEIIAALPEEHKAVLLPQ